MRSLKKVFLILTLLFFIFGCAEKKESEVYNKTADYWYQNMIKALKRGNLEQADDYYTSLASEHMNSPLIKEALLILIEAHLDEEEYLLAQFYADEYIKRFGTAKNIRYAKYLKIKAKYNAFRYPDRDQKLLQETIHLAEKYLYRYPDSIYNPLVQTMLTRLYLSQYQLDRKIISLYKRLGKEKAAQIYEEKIKNSWLKDIKIETKESLFNFLFD
ncbi:MAG: outer membrane protein assembly factor BamD [Epsilonproteobacteria bacterium]|nr:outer membrane protein assembly factor BamD [Campylobacterota bacterium]